MINKFFGLMAGLNMLACAIGFWLDEKFVGALLGANCLVFAVCLGLSIRDQNKAKDKASRSLADEAHRAPQFNAEMIQTVKDAKIKN